MDIIMFLKELPFPHFAGLLLVLLIVYFNPENFIRVLAIMTITFLIAIKFISI